MNKKEIVARLQKASLPEPQYLYQHTDAGEIDIAYPELQIGLKFTFDPGVREKAFGDWIIVFCTTRQIDLNDGLRLLTMAYEDRIVMGQNMSRGHRQMPPHPRHRPADPRIGEVTGKRDLKQTEPENLQAAATVSEMPAHPQDLAVLRDVQVPEELEAVLIHYLGSHLLDSLRIVDGTVDDAVEALHSSAALHQAVRRAWNLLPLLSKSM